MCVYLCSFLTCAWAIFDTFECTFNAILQRVVSHKGLPSFVAKFVATGERIAAFRQCALELWKDIRVLCGASLGFKIDAMQRHTCSPRSCPRQIKLFDSVAVSLYLAILALTQSLSSSSKHAEVSMSFPDAFSSGQDGALRRWSLTDGRCLQEFQSHGDAVRWGLGNRTDCTIPLKRITV